MTAEGRSESDLRLSNKDHASETEIDARRRLTELFRSCPIPEDQILENTGLFLESKNLARLLFMDFLYRQIIEIQGVIIEFGTRWGQNLALFSALRGIYEPFNRHRKIIGFDTFAGFPSVSESDGSSALMQRGNLSVTSDYPAYLERLLETQEALAPLDHIKKFEIRSGDASSEIHRFLEESPHTIVALAYFDFDLYEPTRECLEAIRPRLPRGSVVAFDELNDPDSPGETRALMETFGISEVSLRRYPYVSRTSYFVVE